MVASDSKKGAPGSPLRRAWLLVAMALATWGCGAKCTTLASQVNDAGCSHVWDCPDAEWMISCDPSDGGYACTCADTSGSTRPAHPGFSSQDYCAAPSASQASEASAGCGLQIEE